MPAKKSARVDGRTALIVVAVVGLATARWVAAHLAALILIAAALLALLAVVHFRVRPLIRKRRAGIRALADPHRMSPGQFEQFLADLCLRDGCRNVRVAGGANDHGADVLYVDPHGHRGMIQAKRYAPGNSVGNEHVQIVNGTYRDAHGCAHAAIVTTSHFTQPATAYAKRVGIALVDEQRLTAWINGRRAAAPWN